MGNITAILDQVTPAENRSFTYDALQRLRTGGTASASESYDYDAVGNRTASFLSTTHTHDTSNRLTDDDQFTYTYDANGNLATKTSKTNPSEVTTYTWDAQDQLIKIDFPDSTTATYKYDGIGRRIEKNVNGTITRYVYDGEDILLEYDGTNTFVSRYTHGDRTDQPLMVQRAGVGFFYYHVDHQGSIRNLTDSSGTIANSYMYDSYGQRLSATESVIQPYAYTGREQDPESGLYYYRARHYDPETGRFLSEDPIGFAGGDQNLYGYVLNNPLNFVDPTGQVIPFVIAGGIFAGDVLAAGQTAAAITAAVAGAVALAKTINDARNASSENSTSSEDGRTPNTQDPEGAEESLENAQDVAKKPSSRPSIDDPGSEFDGMKTRPKQSRIQSKKRSQQRARTRRNSNSPC